MVEVTNDYGMRRWITKSQINGLYTPLYTNIQ